MIKGLGKSRVATVLLDIDYPDLKQPLNQFNGLRLNREGAWHLVKSFNKLSEHPIKDQVLGRTFDKFWTELDDAYRRLFPDLHEVAQQISEPLYIAPTQSKRSPRQRHQRDADPGLGNPLKSTRSFSATSKNR